MFGSDDGNNSRIIRFEQPTCFDQAQRNLVRGAVVGAAYGAITSAFTAYTQNYFRMYGAKHSFTFIAHRSGYNTIQFGGFLGIYALARCNLNQMTGATGYQRGSPKDLANAFLAGGLAGGIMSFEFRNPRAMMISAVSSGAMMALLDGISGVMSGF